MEDGQCGRRGMESDLRVGKAVHVMETAFDVSVRSGVEPTERWRKQQLQLPLSLRRLAVRVVADLVGCVWWLKPHTIVVRERLGGSSSRGRVFTALSSPWFSSYPGL